LIPFKKIEIPDISDLIIKQILELLSAGSLKPGQQLPSELQLQKSFGVAKQQLKAAFKKLELYGVLETRPQSGSYIANLEINILCGLISNILDIKDVYDIVSLMDTRMILELRAVELAAERLTDSELEFIKAANTSFFNASGKLTRAIEDDIFFHLEIVKYSKSPSLIALFSFMTKQIIDVWKELDIFSKDKTGNRMEETFNEHSEIVRCLENRDPKGSRAAMKTHMQNVCNETKLIERFR